MKKKFSEDPEYLTRLLAAWLAANNLDPPDYFTMAAMFGQGQTPSNMEDRFRDIRALARVMKDDYRSPNFQQALKLHPKGRDGRTLAFRRKDGSIITDHPAKKGVGKAARAGKGKNGKGKAPTVDEDESDESGSGCNDGSEDHEKDGEGEGGGAAGTTAAEVAA